MSKFYQVSAQLLEKILKQKTSVKNAILSETRVEDKKRCMALICHTLEYRDAIESIIDRSKIESYEKHVLIISLSYIQPDLSECECRDLMIVTEMSR